jgi:LmbE family N-acetylglucosaminyl deacetylase
MLIRYNYPKLTLELLLRRLRRVDANKINPVRVLSIYPHPDDETMASGGLLCTLAQDSRFQVKHVTTTLGEKGDEYWKISPEEMGEVRRKELAFAMHCLCVKDFELWDYGDGQLRQRMALLTERVEQLLEEFMPELIITYEKGGVYGHPDHIHLTIALREAVKTLSEVRRPLILYATLPPKLAKYMGLPTHMADNPGQVLQSEPEYRYHLGFEAINRKYAAATAHESQGLKRGYKVLYWPLLGGYEYYTTQY